MANEAVQVGAGTVNTSGTTIAATNDTLIPASSTILLVISHGGSGLVTGASGGGLVWQVDAAVDTSGFLLGSGITSAYNTGTDIAIGALTVTATVSATTTRKAWQLLYIPGIRPNRVDVTKSNTANPTTTPSTPSLVPTQNGDTLIAAFAVNSLLTSNAGWTAGSGWTKCGFQAPTSSQKTLTCEYRVVGDESSYTPQVTLGTADAYAAVAVAYKIGAPDASISPSTARSQPRLDDRIATPAPAGSGVIFGHSHLNEATTPQVFSRSLYLAKQVYLNRHVYFQHLVYNFSSYAGMGSDEAWLLNGNAWPISNIGGRISGGTTDFPNWVNGVVGSGDAGLQAIAAGTYDTQITAWATALAGSQTLLARPWREMNGNWTPWFTTTAAHYIAAWQRFAGIFRSVAPNVQLCWCPAFSGGGVTGTADHTGIAYYPGDAYVDWVGIDGYRTSPNYYPPTTLFTPIHGVFGPGGSNGVEKPIIVCETSPATTMGTINSPDPVTWLSTMPAAMKALPGIRALCFWEETAHPLTIPEGAASDTDAEYLSIIGDDYLNPSVILPQVPGISVLGSGVHAQAGNRDVRIIAVRAA